MGVRSSGRSRSRWSSAWLSTGVAWAQPAPPTIPTPLPIPFPIPVPTPGPTPTPPSQPGPTVVFPPFDPAACVAKPQRLLIFDMKSGWWSGDGAEFHDLLLPRIVKDCPSIDIEYYFLQHVDGEELPPGVTLPPGFQVGVIGFLSFYPNRAGNPNGGFMGATYPSRPWNEYSPDLAVVGQQRGPDRCADHARVLSEPPVEAQHHDGNGAGATGTKRLCRDRASAIAITATACSPRFSYRSSFRRMRRSSRRQTLARAPASSRCLGCAPAPS